jgi:sodium transport system permease protein
MKLTNVKWIFLREMRDQLRDRRTLFMIAVLPILLYPLLGLSMFQVSQFMQEQPTRVLVVGAPDLANTPALFEKDQLAMAICPDPNMVRLLQLEFVKDISAKEQPETDSRAEARNQVQAGRYEAALYFPPDFAERLGAFQKTIQRSSDKNSEKASEKDAALRLEVPSPEVIYTTANDKSQIAFARLSEVLRRWTEEIGNANLKQSGVPQTALRPFQVQTADVADEDHREASMWSKILPVLMLLWALTGAFYPAVDLCAGEKERGTLETLLCSPAERSEIVMGKLLTVMAFSIFTAVLNLASMGMTGCVVSTHMPGITMPPVTALAAMLLALIPIAALFSALCLALAAFARSSKEGQYYLMPMLVITMPLVILPMSPGIELNLGNSLIPVTGVVLLLRNVLEGNYWLAFQYLPAIVLVTFFACLFSIRWAIEQFNSESVLFRESERLDIGLWLRHLIYDRQATPTVAMSICCGVLILVLNFFMSFAQPKLEGFGDFVYSALTTQFAVILVPTLVLTVMLTRNPRQTLLLKWPSWLTVPAAFLLAVVMHPVANALQTLVAQCWQVNDSVQPALEKIQNIFHQADFWPMVLVIALTPAICEELAFRGFILSGFRHMGHKWRAIIFSAVFFGATHGILQQSVIASCLGVLLGFIAIQTGSILPGMVFHMVHNALAVANTRITPDMVAATSPIRKFATPLETGGCTFTWPTVAAGVLSVTLVLMWFAKLNSKGSAEEELEAAIERGQHENVPLVPNEAAF